MSHLILQWQNAVFLQQVLFTEMPGKQDFVFLLLRESKYTQEYFAKTRQDLKTAWLIVKTSETFIQGQGFFLQLSHVNGVTKSMTICSDSATRFEEIYGNNSSTINNPNWGQN